MKKLSLVLVAAIGLVLPHISEACSYDTIQSIVSPINPYEANASSQLQMAFETLSLCDENLSYAGQLCGHSFNPYEGRSTKLMSEVVQQESSKLPPDLIEGLGLAMISELNLYEYASTVYMLRAVLSLGKAAPQHAKRFALALLKEQNAYERASNEALLQAVRTLNSYSSVKPPANGGSSIWAFRAQNQVCEYVRGPWGRYELCPSYYASVSDKYGNRIILACNSEHYGIEFRVGLGQELWSKVSSTSIQTMTFGTESLLQSMGVPYLINEDRTLLAEEALAPELLEELRRAKELKIGVRANSGEINHELQFTLKGSNVAIQQLLQACQ
jgi:hypothetical protein